MFIQDTFSLCVSDPHTQRLLKVLRDLWILIDELTPPEWNMRCLCLRNILTSLLVIIGVNFALILTWGGITLHGLHLHPSALSFLLALLLLPPFLLLLIFTLPLLPQLIFINPFIDPCLILLPRLQQLSPIKI